MVGSSSIFNKDILEGKVALVTGGHSGIGLVISTEYGKHGAKVALMGRRQKVLEEAVKDLQGQGIQAMAVAGDVRKKEDAHSAVQAVIAQFGKLDILVNGAAGNFLVPAEDLSGNGFRTVVDIDAVGTYMMSLAALPYLKQGAQGKLSHEAGNIINISATTYYSASWYQIHVSAAKAAVDSITRSLALEWGTDYKIRVNSIAPGPVADTPGMAKLAPPEAGNRFYEQIPLGKMSDKVDIANAAIFLASDAGKMITGTIVVVDGGHCLGKPRSVSKEFVQGFSRSHEQKMKTTVTSKL